MQKVLEPIQRVRFTKSTLRQASIRDKKGPSLGKIQVKPRHQRNAYAMKSEAWNFAKSTYKLRAKDKATFFSLTEKWVLPRSSARDLKEREREYAYGQ